MYNRIDLPLSPSVTVGLLATAPWLGLAAAALLAAWQGTVLVLAVLPLAAAGTYSRWHRCGSLNHPQAVVRLVVSHGRLTALLANSTELEVTVAGGSRTGGTLTIVELVSLGSGGRRSVILAPAVGLPFSLVGNTTPDALRRFRVWLRLMPPTEQSAAPAVARRPFLTRFRPGGKLHARDN